MNQTEFEEYNKNKVERLCHLLDEHGLELTEVCADEEEDGGEKDDKMDADLTELERLKQELMKSEKTLSEQPKQEEGETFGETLAFLDEMVGMEHVKAKLLRLGRYVQWKKKLEAEGIDIDNLPEPNLTFMFVGDPGTGKTTVAYRMGRILYSLGLLSTRKVMEFRREDLVGQNYGAEEEKTRDALRRSYGSVFFLDEAYQCFKQSTDRRDPGYHILETMMAQFGAPGRCIIMAGYKREMEELFKVNPGFSSRIPKENIIEFKSATERTLLEIAVRSFGKMELQMTPGAKSLLRGFIHDMSHHRDKQFGNARTIRQFTESAVINHANRIMMSTACDDFKITKADLQQSLKELQSSQSSQPSIGFA